MTSRVTGAALGTILWLPIAAYAAAVVVGPDAFPGMFTSSLVLLLSILIPLCFGLLHGAIRYGITGIAVFLLVTLAVSNVMEDASVLTGFPFGHYHYTDVLGSKLFLVPILIGPAYFGTIYLCWMLATILLRTDARRDALATLAVPVVAAFMVVGWDACIDPGHATIEHLWIWENGGGHFGVPLTNFLGWYFTAYVILQLFALYRVWQPVQAPAALPRGYWYQACTFFAVMALDHPAQYLGQKDVAIADATGRIWHTGDIHESMAIVSLCTMLFVATTSFAVLLLRDAQAADRTYRRGFHPATRPRSPRAH
jgi:putative membrane protein